LAYKKTYQNAMFENAIKIIYIEK